NGYSVFYRCNNNCLGPKPLVTATVSSISISARPRVIGHTAYRLAPSPGTFPFALTSPTAIGRHLHDHRSITAASLAPFITRHRRLWPFVSSYHGGACSQEHLQTFLDASLLAILKCH